ncbi:hypothetical protein [Clavibacter michiganensis]|uniref:MmyB family transcriptional regulator n=1 Tax=Clavibacter michiganensis TaxID=28447 RepID=UPI0009B92D3F|nr:hypothetical protein [Clavibacter michiganensis]
MASPERSPADAPDARAVELVGELSLASAGFRAPWGRHDVRSLDGGTTTVHHPPRGDEGAAPREGCRADRPLGGGLRRSSRSSRSAPSGEAIRWSARSRSLIRALSTGRA